jgi:phosphoglycerate dehydrogenase-like enzyme
MNNIRPKAAFLCTTDRVPYVYAAGRRAIVEQLTDCYPAVVSPQSLGALAADLAGVEVIFSTWGMPLLTSDQLDLLPNLKAVFYGAGSVQGFARPLLERGITVVSAWSANAVPVAEFVLAQILLSNKGYFRNMRACTSYDGYRAAPRGPGNFGETVAILGAGQVGRHVICLLKPFNLKVVVADPFLTVDDAAALGVEKVSMEDAFARGHVVSNHIPNLPQTRQTVTGAHFQAMRTGATYINTGRGQTVNEPEMIAVLKARQDLTALLDVTDPEPPRSGAQLYGMPNVFLSTHIAGCIGDEVVRLADYMIEEFKAWRDGRPLRYAVTLKMLETMA